MAVFHFSFFYMHKGGYGAYRYFQQYFSYIAVVSFISGGNRSVRRKTDLPQVTDKLNHIMLCRVHLAMSRVRYNALHANNSFI